MIPENTDTPLMADCPSATCSASSGDDHIANLTKHWRENAEKLRAREKKYPMDSDEAKRLRSQSDMFDHCAYELETW